MKLEAYWQHSAPAFVPAPAELPARVDVAVVGAGFTGLSAALALARRGATVAVLEAHGRVAAEASGRNGGHVNNGLAVDYPALAARLGSDGARAWYHAFDAAVDTVEAVVREEAIDCDFQRNGKLKLGTRPQHYGELARAAERLIRDGVDTELDVLDAAQVRVEVGSERFSGGLLYRKSAQMHMGRFAHGLAQAAERAGARIHLGTPVQRLQPQAGRGGAHRLHVPHGVVEADQVLLATGTSRHGDYASFGWLRRRLVPIGSFIVVTAPMSAAQAQALLRARRTYTTVANIHHYFRLTADHRLVFGGRARFAVSSPQADARSGEILRQGLLQTFPALAGLPIDYCWGGLVDMSADRLPRAGVRHGIHYSVGYSGHGTQMSVHMGRHVAAAMAGAATPQPWDGRGDWPAIPGHLGPPWFLPALGLYYQLKDRLQN
ncbi:FAD-binding oxidoreductase [Xanthomonas campestris pv. cannae]|nr:FAD-binding oxidoreductase [Xanthomonas campestris pv. cannae]